MRIVIIDYGAGNLRSVRNAFAALGAPVSLARAPSELKEADGIVLPGVGAFGDGMRNLRTGNWIGVLNEEVLQKGKRFLGICLGMQLLATTGMEHGVHQGLNWIAGVVDRMTPADATCRIPHIGWNDVQFVRPGRMYAGMGESAAFYFVHSYALHSEDAGVISGEFDHGGARVASIERGNIWATQFHPEKSQKAGLQVLQNFIRGG